MPESPPAKATRKKRSQFNAALLSSASIAILFHVALLVVIGSVVIFEGKVPPIFFEGGVDTGAVTDELEAPPMLEEEIMPEPDAGGMGSPNEEAVTDAIDLTDLVVASEASLAPAFSMPLSVGNPNISVGKISGGSGKKGPAGFGLGGGGKGKVKLSSLFGSKKLGTGVLTGYLYDLKQDANGNLNEIGKGYQTGGTTQRNQIFRPALEDFLKKWDEQELQKFYRAKDPLKTTQILIPGMNASGAPEAFGVAGEVEPSALVIHYKGRILAPGAGGKFRFVGITDDLMFVLLDNKLVLDGNWRTKWFPEAAPERVTTATGREYAGKWFNLRPASVYPIEILISEVPGGSFYSRLFIQKQDEKYQTDSNGGLILPPFQMMPTEIPGSFKGKVMEDAPFFGSE